MNKQEIVFCVEGQDAEAGADEIKKIINDVFEYAPQVSVEKEKTRQGNTRGFDPVAVSALVLAIPGTILAVAGLADRMKKKKQLDGALKKIKTQVVEKDKVTVKITYPDGTVKEISTVDSVEILDHFSK